MTEDRIAEEKGFHYWPLRILLLVVGGVSVGTTWLDFFNAFLVVFPCYVPSWYHPVWLGSLGLLLAAFICFRLTQHRLYRLSRNFLLISLAGLPPKWAINTMIVN